MGNKVLGKEKKTRLIVGGSKLFLRRVFCGDGELGKGARGHGEGRGFNNEG